MHRLNPDPFDQTQLYACTCAGSRCTGPAEQMPEVHKLKVHRSFPAVRGTGPSDACLQVPANAHTGAQVLPGQVCLQVPAYAQLKVHRLLQVSAKAQTQGAQALPGQACLQVQVPAKAQAQGAQALRLRRARRCQYTQGAQAFQVRRARRRPQM